MSQYNLLSALKNIEEITIDLIRLSKESIDEFMENPKNNILSIGHYFWRGIYLNYIVWKNMKNHLEEETTKGAVKTSLEAILEGSIPLEQKVKFNGIPYNLREEREPIDLGVLGYSPFRWLPWIGEKISIPNYSKIAVVDFEEGGRTIQGFRKCYGEDIPRRLKKALGSGGLAKIRGIYTTRNGKPSIRIKTAKAGEYEHIDIA